MTMAGITRRWVILIINHDHNVDDIYMTMAGKVFLFY